MPGTECKFSSLTLTLKQIKILTSCHRSASKNSKDFIAGLLFFLFSSNGRSAVLQLYKSWYETLFFADRAVIAAILNSLDILSFRSFIISIIVPKTCFRLLIMHRKPVFVFLQLTWAVVRFISGQIMLFQQFFLACS